LVLGAGIALVIIGIMIHAAAAIILVLAGLAAVACGGVQFVPRNTRSGQPPGPT
jgi:hypothetical protein